MEEGANKKTYEKLHKDFRFMDLIVCIKKIILASNLNEKHIKNIIISKLNTDRARRKKERKCKTRCHCKNS